MYSDSDLTTLFSVPYRSVGAHSQIDSARLTIFFESSDCISRNFSYEKSKITRNALPPLCLSLNYPLDISNKKSI